VIQLISVYSEVKDNYLRERAADIDDVRTAVMER
jgi:phosphoenolpyruvate-protein kinase (PTS system EI component)